MTPEDKKRVEQARMSIQEIIVLMERRRQGWVENYALDDAIAQLRRADANLRGVLA